MLYLKNGIEISEETLSNNLTRLINQIYKLLPNREEGLDWIKPLDNITEELAGMGDLLNSEQNSFFQLLCKLKGLKSLSSDEDFALYRRIIFECLSLLNGINEALCQQKH